MIDIQNLQYAYGKIEALKGISIHVKQGEILSIIGANGAGKSTLMQCLAGRLNYQGSIVYKGAPLPKSPTRWWRKVWFWYRKGGGSFPI